MIKVVNITKDGVVLNSLEGFCPPPDSECWKVLREITKRRAERGQQAEADGRSRRSAEG